jgi:hypothetical protein
LRPRIIAQVSILYCPRGLSESISNDNNKLEPYRKEIGFESATYLSAFA